MRRSKQYPLLKTSEKDRKRKGRHEPIEKIVNFEMQEGFFPKYLTSRKLFNLQLKDPFFRRQILVQFTIIYQFLLSLAKPVEIPVADAKDPKVTPPVPVILNKSLQYPFSISESQEKWVLDTRTKSLKILEAISPHLKRFSSTTHTVITHEKNWVKWKSDLCPSFEKAPVKFEAKRRRLEMSIAVQKDNLGSDELTKLWTLGKNPLAVLADKSRGSVIPQLEDFLEPLTDQLNPDGTVAEGVEDEYLYSNDKVISCLSQSL
ncbi:THO complex, subunit THOC1 [Chytridium lagenaria]|nr:THO complex, subunit THOC1 [Chytridium lagenaria]